MTQTSTSLSFANRLNGMQVSSILLLAQTAREMKTEGLEVVDLTSGQSDFDAPENIRLAAKAAIDRGETRYTSITGIPELQAAICVKF